MMENGCYDCRFKPKNDNYCQFWKKPVMSYFICPEFLEREEDGDE